MLLTIDIGNTNVVCAVFDSSRQLDHVRIPSDLNFWKSFYPLHVHPVSGVVIGSVVPRLTHVYVEACRNIFRLDPLVIDHRNAGLQIDVPHPEQAGADRICNVVAAADRYPLPAVVVDFGTATTFDIVDADGVFIGGVIAPGIKVSANYLMEKAALLDDVALRIPETVIGKDTAANLQAGIMFGAIDEVHGMVRRILNETGWKKMSVILTGGFSRLISPGLEIEHQLAPQLTLEGMQIIYQRNHGQEQNDDD